MIRAGTVCSTRPKKQPIEVELEPLSSCGSCSKSGGCGIAILPLETSKLVVECINPGGLTLMVGDAVQVRLNEPDSSWLGLVGKAYGFPTFGMLAGAFIGDHFSKVQPQSGWSGTFAFIGFTVGLAIGILAWRRAAFSVANEKRHRDGDELPRIVGRLVGKT